MSRPDDSGEALGGDHEETHENDDGILQAPLQHFRCVSSIAGAVDDDAWRPHRYYHGHRVPEKTVASFFFLILKSLPMAALECLWALLEQFLCESLGTTSPLGVTRYLYNETMAGMAAVSHTNKDNSVGIVQPRVVFTPLAADPRTAFPGMGMFCVLFGLIAGKKEGRGGQVL